MDQFVDGAGSEHIHDNITTIEDNLHSIFSKYCAMKFIAKYLKSPSNIY